MKTKILFFAILAIAILTLSSCTKDKTVNPTVAATETYIDATSSASWNYFSLSKNELVGIGAESDEINEAWAARTDWDIAINRYMIRTNSGAATSINSQGGVYTCDASVTFASLMSLPSGATFTPDEIITSAGMGGVTTSVVKSTATVITFQKNEDGSLVMPPVYLKSPIYIFRTANGSSYYKVEFTQYQNDSKVTGHVKFYSAQIQ